MERVYGNTCTGCGKIKQEECSRSRKGRFEVYGIPRVRYLFCCNIMPSSRPFDLLQHPKELARQITLIDHGMTFDIIHVFDYI